jgi:hypothetical protein
MLGTLRVLKEAEMTFNGPEMMVRGGKVEAMPDLADD